MPALRAHAEAVTAHHLLDGGDIDFKLAASPGPRNDATRRETKMDTLVVRRCEELVTLGPLARNRADPRASTAPHLTPQQWHDLLARAAAERQEQQGQQGQQQGRQEQEGRAQGVAAAGPGEGTSADGAAAEAASVPEESVAGGGEEGPLGPVVLLDARNVYETRIGHFDVGPDVPTLDPRTRAFSDLPAWMDANEAELRGRTVLMYCTGGVRCERASAYLREKGPGFGRVFQLSGGIQRYLEAFPDGGFFRGKNFLYDDRIAVGPAAAAGAPDSAAECGGGGGVVGRCLLCGCNWDDYGERLRCSRCRLLLLVCDDCRAARIRTHGPCGDAACGVTAAAAAPGAPQEQKQHEDEEEGGGADGAASSSAAVTAAAAPPPPPSPGGRLPGPPLLCELCSGGHSCDTNVSGDRIRNGEAGDADGAATRASPLPSPAKQRSQQPQQGRSIPHAGGAAAVAAAAAGIEGPPPPQATAGAGVPSAPAPVSASAPPARRLRVLCLHGFRQTGKQFQGRTCALRKKLRDVADFVFVDAPHCLPYFVKEAGGTADGADAARCSADGGAAVADDGAGVGDGGVCVDAADGEDGGFGDDGGLDAEAESPAVTPSPRKARSATATAAAAKRAWLLPPELYDSSAAATLDGDASPPPPAGATEAASADAGRAASYTTAPSYVDELQYTRQTAGWAESLAALRAAVAELGPFDGVFGFSQGAAVAAVLCALQQEQQQQRRNGDNTEPAGPGCDFGFRFAILASGFPPPAPELQTLLERVGPLELPSLHVYGSGGGAAAGDGGAATADRQIPRAQSEALAAAFAAAGGGRDGGGGGVRRRCLVHQCGHLIPATRAHAETFRAFLLEQLSAVGAATKE